MGGGDFCKKVDLSPKNETKLILDFLYFTYWGGGCVRTQRIPPLPTNLLSLVSVKSRLVFPFWYRLTWVVPENGHKCVCVLH